MDSEPVRADFRHILLGVRVPTVIGVSDIYVAQIPAWENLNHQSTNIFADLAIPHHQGSVRNRLQTTYVNPGIISATPPSFGNTLSTTLPSSFSHVFLLLQLKCQQWMSTDNLNSRCQQVISTIHRNLAKPKYLCLELPLLCDPPR